MTIVVPVASRFCMAAGEWDEPFPQKYATVLKCDCCLFSSYLRGWDCADIRVWRPGRRSRGRIFSRRVNRGSKASWAHRLLSVTFCGQSQTAAARDTRAVFSRAPFGGWGVSSESVADGTGSTCTCATHDEKPAAFPLKSVELAGTRAVCEADSNWPQRQNGNKCHRIFETWRSFIYWRSANVSAT